MNTPAPLAGVFCYAALLCPQRAARLCLRPVKPESSATTATTPADPGLSAAVAASAGTGKTYLLVTRIIRLLLAGARPAGILALTFTRKAAAEMRDRLFARLSELALAPDEKLLQELGATGIAQPEHYLDQARTLFEQLLYADQRPRITTFHAFCQELLHRFPLEAGVPPAYQLLETTGLVEDMAWDAMCLHATRQPDGPLATALTTLFSACGGLNNSRDALVRGFLQHRSDWWAYTEQQPDPVAFATGKLNEKLNAEKEPLAGFFNTQTGEELKHYLALLQQHATATNLKHCRAIEQGLEPEQDPAPRFRILQSVFLTQTGQPRQLKASKTLEKALGADNQQQLLSLHEQLAGRVLHTLEHIRRKQYLELNSAWYLAGQALLDQYQTIKRQQRALDFADLEWRCYRLLRASDQALWIQYKLDQRIDHLLLDEFQDTNPTQWQLILPLLDEIAAGDAERLRSVFLVGDGKQSIYSFRRANPQLQQTAGAWLNRQLNAETYSLDKSWRSSPAIVDFLNAVFSADDPSQNRLPDYERHTTHQDGLWGEVLLLPAIVESPATTVERDNVMLRDPLTEPRIDAEESAHYREGLQLAETIQALLGENRLIDDGSPLDYGDIMILLRSRTHAAHYERALTDREIPFTGIEKGGLLNALEIRDIEALLKILITPFDNLALAQVLRSPIISASDEVLQHLALPPAGNWYEKLLKPEITGAAPALARAATLLPRWRSLAGHLPVHDLLDRIYFEGDIINRYQQSCRKTNRDTVKANLQQLLELALQIDSGRYPSLMRFLNRLSKLRGSADEAPDSPAPGEGTGKVRLLTIHGAKGLEAPVVMLADSAAAGSGKDTYNAIVDWRADDARPQMMVLSARKEDSPELLMQLRAAGSSAQAREESNLLYVALSRARHMLVISAAGNERTLKTGWYGVLRNTIQNIAEPTADGGYRYRSGQPETTDNRIATGNRKQPPNIRPLPELQNIPQADPVPQSVETGRFRAQRHGTWLHKLIEALSPPQPAAGIEPLRAQAVFFSDDEWQSMVKQASRIISHPRFAFLFDPEHYDRAYKEVPVCFTNRNNEIRNGIIDRLVLKDDEAWIIDYKSHGADPDPATAAGLYKPQLDFYAAGIKKIWPQRTVREAILFLDRGELIELDTAP